MKISLIGFMAVGKTAAGRALAERRGVRFVDLDEAIAARAGKPVPEIIRNDGEPRFRELEAAELGRQLGGDAEVIAAGGGAPCDPDNMRAMRAAGLVVELTAPIDVSIARASGGDRPLLGDRDQAVARLASRRPAYRQAHAVVDTAELAPDAVAARIDRLVPIAGSLGESLAASAICALERAPYAIAVEPDSVDHLGERVRASVERVTRVAVISDRNVAGLYLDRAIAALGAAGLSASAEVIEPGEASKNPAEHRRLAEALVSAGLDRRSAVIALGGGVVGDLAGYVAATLYRGVALVQVPTSVVAVVDSAIGGKTGVNLDAGKNLLGAFWQPAAVAVDPRLLDTLPDRERRAGFGELLKYGLLDGPELFELVCADPLGAASLRRCATYKSWIVTRDERELLGERALLNLGHTVGHAIERAAGYGEVLHGEAVALGLIAAARVSTAVTGAPADLEIDITEALRSAGLDTDLDRWLTPGVLRHLEVDKKRTGDRIGFVALSAIGRPEIVHLSAAEIGKILVPPRGL
jgi:shikimate kinase/3-dehydroquinate synthase